mmetsp:Transcript_3938/g.7558  ORF Transcript_3938/g.7558 Transcript_3938/m.7558 type:complete len:100 (-) Transcript_3938:251-550(-)
MAEPSSSQPTPSGEEIASKEPAANTKKKSNEGGNILPKIIWDSASLEAKRQGQKRKRVDNIQNDAAGNKKLHIAAAHGHGGGAARSEIHFSLIDFGDLS